MIRIKDYKNIRLQTKYLNYRTFFDEGKKIRIITESENQPQDGFFGVFVGETNYLLFLKTILKIKQIQYTVVLKRFICCVKYVETEENMVQ